MRQVLKCIPKYESEGFSKFKEKNPGPHWKMSESIPSGCLRDMKLFIYYIKKREICLFSNLTMLTIRAKPNQHPHGCYSVSLAGWTTLPPSQKDTSYITVLKQFVFIMFIKQETFLLELLKDCRTEVKMCGWVHLLRWRDLQCFRGSGDWG